jgi:hypothetical protein
LKKPIAFRDEATRFLNSRARADDKPFTIKA